MASPPPSSENSTPYKSRLLNFLNRQSINIRDKIGINSRQLQLILATGVKTLLYPVYFLLQTIKITNQKIFSSSARKDQKINSFDRQEIPLLPDIDQPIKEVLQVIEKEYLNTNNSLNLQSIATNIKDNKLVLINFKNQIIYTLSKQEKSNITLLIREKKANYWEQKRVFTLANQSLKQNLFDINNTENKTIFLLEFFYKLSIWFQKKSIDNSLNLLQEYPDLQGENLTLINSNHQHKQTENIGFIFNNYFLNIIDKYITKIENLTLFKTEDLIEIKAEQNTFLIKQNEDKSKFFLQNLIKMAINYFFGNHQNIDQIIGDRNQNQNLLSDSTKENQKLLTEHSLIKNSLINIESQINSLLIKGKITLSNFINKQEENPFQIKGLITAGINYFLEQKNYFNLPNSYSQLVNQSSLVNNLNQEIKSEQFMIEEAWLSWDDLYSNNIPNNLIKLPFINTDNQSNHNHKKDQSNLILTKDNNVSLKSYNELIFKEYNINNFQEEKITVKSNSNNQKLSKNKLIENKTVIENKNLKKVINSNVINKAKNKSNVVEEKLKYQPNYLEIKAINLGYEKHFLEIILEWLDKIILWLEELLIKIWQKISSKTP